MRIVHCCLAAFYIDDAGYQENILPRMHKLQGHDVTILASTETFINNRDLGYLQPSSYLNSDGIPVTRLPYRSGIPNKLVRKLRLYDGIYEHLNRLRPDIIFLHDCQFLGIRDIVRYVKLNPDTRVFVDGHTDFINSARSWPSKWLLHGVIYRHCAKAIEPYTTKFFGVLPARVEFFEKMYGISPSKTDLLVLGVDDTLIDWTQQASIRARIRKSIGLSESDFLLATGGKIDRRKNIHILIHALKRIPHDELRLVVCGTPSREMEAEFESLCHDERVRYVGWVDSKRLHEYFMAADLGVFPGTHSVLWEQAVGSGLPCVFRRWEGMQHVDVGGNCCFLNSDSEDELVECLTNLINDKPRLAEMKRVAQTRGTKEFAYTEIAKRAIASDKPKFPQSQPKVK